jgi:F-box protein 9
LAKEVRSLSISTDPDDTLVPDAHVKPTSALEHFEQAVSKEAQGMLGESLDLYRKAYKVCQCSFPLVRVSV